MEKIFQLSGGQKLRTEKYFLKNYMLDRGFIEEKKLQLHQE